ncbi:hypothetical protein [Sphingomonas sp.]|jgi:hypothetical protein|uniref:hypothetical protein n=1 Tax=Sphingomonas sp. TaxID=28214 RepID=UPI002ED796CE
MQDLPFQTLTQFVALGLTLLAGWLLGLASTSGGRKWRERYHDVEIDSAGYRDRAESDLRDAARRIRDLEAENAQLRAATPAREDHGHSPTTVAGAALAGAAAGAVATHAADDHQAEDHHAQPVAAAHPEPADAQPAQVEPAQDDHGHAPAVQDSHGDNHHAPADTHHH